MGHYKIIRLNPELPRMLKSGCTKLIDPIEKEVFLISAFGVISGLLPKVQDFYDTKDYGKNLYIYILPQSRKFKNVFDKKKHDYPAYFMELGNEMTTLYDRLINLDTPIHFQLSDDQQPPFLLLFQDWKDEFVSDDLEGTVNRLGLIFFRITMILSTLRSYEEDGLLRKITCSELDFSPVLSFTKTLKQISLRLYYWFPKIKPTTKKSDIKKKKNKLMRP